MKSYIDQGKILSTVWLASLLVFSTCTDLEVEEKDSYKKTSDGGFTPLSPEARIATLQSAYADLRGDNGFGNQENMYAMHEVTSDELLVPTRGTDWGDNGIWRSLHQHTWDETHAYILNAWNILNKNVYKTNTILASSPTLVQDAESRFLRAFNMWHVLDFFRQIPFREVTDGVDVDPRVMTPQEGFEFIVADLTAALPNLPVTNPSGDTKRASRAAANFLLAKLYLNKHIYTGGEAQAADMTKVIEYVDAITADGFALHDDYFDIFKDATNTETIFWSDASYGNRIWNGLHYFQKTYKKSPNDTYGENTGGGWNGFATTAEFYSKFEGNPDSNEPGEGQEERRGYVPTEDDWYGAGIGYGFLFGQQYDSAGNAMLDRTGKPLAYTKEFANETSLTGNSERHGIRIIKYHPRNGSYGSYYILARYADAYLMKIEAILRGGSSSDNPIALYNVLRTEYREASPVANVTLQDILDERGRELYTEGWRRNDQVRFGTYTQPFPYMENTEPHRNVFPIPANALTSNPNLKQNPGYAGE